MCTIKILQVFYFLFPFPSSHFFKPTIYVCVCFNQCFCTGWELHEHKLFVVITTHPASGIVPKAEKQVLSKYLSNEGKKQQYSKYGVLSFLHFLISLPLMVLQPFLTVHTDNLKLGDLFEVYGLTYLQTCPSSSPLFIPLFSPLQITHSLFPQQIPYTTPGQQYLTYLAFAGCFSL